MPLEHQSPVKIAYVREVERQFKFDTGYVSHLFDDSSGDKNVDISRAKLFDETRRIAWCHFDAGRDFALSSCDKTSSHSIVCACCISIEMLG